MFSRECSARTWIRCSGAPSRASSWLISSTVRVLVWMARLWGVMMMAFRPFRANMALHMGVTDGLVVGVMAATTPTGLAIFTVPAAGFRSMIPTDFLPFRLFQMMLALPRFLATLSS